MLVVDAVTSEENIARSVRVRNTAASIGNDPGRLERPRMKTPKLQMERARKKSNLMTMMPDTRRNEDDIENDQDRGQLVEVTVVEKRQKKELWRIEGGERKNADAKKRRNTEERNLLVVSI